MAAPAVTASDLPFTVQPNTGLLPLRYGKQGVWLTMTRTVAAGARMLVNYTAPEGTRLMSEAVDDYNWPGVQGRCAPVGDWQGMSCDITTSRTLNTGDRAYLMFPVQTDRSAALRREASASVALASAPGDVTEVKWQNRTVRPADMSLEGSILHIRNVDPETQVRLEDPETGALVKRLGEGDIDLQELNGGMTKVTAQSYSLFSSGAWPLDAKRVFEIGRVHAVPPVVTSPAAGTILGADPVRISGTAEPRSTVSVGSWGATTITDDTGHWSADVTVPAADKSIGELPIAVSATNPDGESQVGLPLVMNAARGFTASGPTPTTTDVRPQISGRGVPGTTVVVSEGTAVLARGAVPATGWWQLRPTADLSVGDHTLDARHANGADVSTKRFEVKVREPERSAPLVIEKPGSIFWGKELVIEGTADPNAKIVVSGTRGELGRTSADEGGRFSVQSGTDLSPGGYELTVAATAGNGDVRTAQVRVTFLRSVTLTSPTNQGSVNTNRPTLTGTGQPGATVRAVRSFGADPDVLATATVKPDGTWTLRSDRTLDDGYVSFWLEQNFQGHTDTKLFGLVIHSQAGATLDVRTPTENGFVAERRPVFTGIGKVGATITIVGTRATIGTTTVNERNGWSVASTVDLPDGAYTVAITQRNSSDPVQIEERTFHVRANVVTEADR